MISSKDGTRAIYIDFDNKEEILHYIRQDRRHIKKFRFISEIILGGHRNTDVYDKEDINEKCKDVTAMKFKDKYNISNEFDDIFTFNNEEEELDHEAQMLMFKFLEEIENLNITGSKLKKKDLAKALGKSPSFISQLYSGDKILNFKHLAKIQKAFNINFEIKVHDNFLSYRENSKKIKIKSFHNDPEGFWVWMNKNPDYSRPDKCCDTFNSSSNDINAA